MNTAGLQKVFKSAIKSASKNAPLIMTCVGVVSIVSTAILAVTATPKAMDVIENGRDILDDKEITAEEAKQVRKQMILRIAKCYWKPAASAALGITAVIFANRIQHKRYLGLASAYAISIKELADWKETARELKLINKNGEQKIRDKLAEKKVKEAKDKPKQQVIFTGTGDDLFMDEWSGQIFKSSVTEVDRAVNDWNGKMLREDQVTLNDLYYLLGIKEVPAGDLGFEASYGLVDVVYGSALVDGKAYITMAFDRQPRLL